MAISIHASLAGGDVFFPPDRRARPNFNPRLPRGRRPPLPDSDPVVPHISIHASLAGGDAFSSPNTLSPTIFQSTPPSREATRTK